MLSIQDLASKLLWLWPTRAAFGFVTADTDAGRRSFRCRAGKYSCRAGENFGGRGRITEDENRGSSVVRPE
jgi:hypothetical protein